MSAKVNPSEEATVKPKVLKATVMGIDLEIDEGRLADMTVLELVATFDTAANTIVSSKALLDLLRFLFPDWERIRKELTNENGLLPISKFETFITEVFTAFDLKN